MSQSWDEIRRAFLGSVEAEHGSLTELRRFHGVREAFVSEVDEDGPLFEDYDVGISVAEQHDEQSMCVELKRGDRTILTVFNGGLLHANRTPSRDELIASIQELGKEYIRLRLGMRAGALEGGED